MSRLKSKDRKSINRIISGICGNLAAGWFGLIIIAPGFDFNLNVTDYLTLIKSMIMGILFAWLAFEFDRR